MSTKMVILKSSDGELFEVEEAVALWSRTIQTLTEAGCEVGNAIPLPNVAGRVLAKVLEYCRRHAAGGDAEALESWDAEFVKLDRVALIDLAAAANYMEIEDLLDLACQAVVDTFQDKTVEEVREIFGIENDFSPEEEAALRNENKWAFD